MREVILLSSQAKILWQGRQNENRAFLENVGLELYAEFKTA